MLQSAVKCCEPERVYETDVRETVRAMKREVSSVLQRQVARRERVAGYSEWCWNTQADIKILNCYNQIYTVPKHDILVRYSIADFHIIISKSGGTGIA
jgi:hypothetical protein